MAEYCFHNGATQFALPVASEERILPAASPIPVSLSFPIVFNAMPVLLLKYPAVPLMAVPATPICASAIPTTPVFPGNTVEVPSPVLPITPVEKLAPDPSPLTPELLSSLVFP